MAEQSLFWTGTAIGDASIAPYDHLEFTNVYNKLFASSGAGYIVPAYNNNLKVQASAPAAATVDILTGAAFIQGFLYENTVLITQGIAANASGNPRIDRIVLRIDFVNQTVRMNILTGTPAAVPALPALTQTYGTTWEISLAWIWVANGFATITNADIHDERQFIPTALSRERANGGHNLLINSEFIYQSGVGVASTGTLWNGQPGWYLAGGAQFPAFVQSAKPAQQQRGHSLTVSAPIGQTTYIFQPYDVLPSTVYTYRGLTRPDTAPTTNIRIYDLDNAADITLVTLRKTAVYFDEVIRFTTPANCTHVALIIETTTNNAGFTLGQQIVVPGYVTPDYETKHEWIYHIAPVPITNWAFTAKSSGTTTIDLTSVGIPFGIYDIQAIQLMMAGNDSGSAANVCFMKIMVPGAASPYDISAVLDLGKITNDDKVYEQAVVRTQVNTGGLAIANHKNQLTVVVQASGAGTFDAYLGIMGVLT